MRHAKMTHREKVVDLSNVTRNRFMFGCILFFIVMTVSSCSFAQDLSYMDFLLKVKLTADFEQELIDHAGNKSLAERWELVSSSRDDLSSASMSYSIMVELLNGEDLSRLDEISGFITEKNFLDKLSFPDSPGISRQLLVLQSALNSLAFLCRYKSASSLGITKKIFDSLEVTELFRNVTALSGKVEYDIMYEHFSTVRGLYEKVYGGSFT